MVCQFPSIKGEFFASDDVQLWNMAVVEEILKKVPSHERLIWQVFENIQLGYVEDWPLKFIRFMVSRLDNMNYVNKNAKNNKYDTAVSGRSGYHCSEGATSTAGPVPMALTVAARRTKGLVKMEGQPGLLPIVEVLPTKEVAICRQVPIRVQKRFTVQCRKK
jgi:hypothetical protein